jgi:hypothetical protein
MSHGNSSRQQGIESTHSTMQHTAEPEHAGVTSTSESSNSNSRSSGTINSTPSQPTDLASEDERFRILQELESSVETFRSGKTTKTDAVSSVIRILGENTNVTLTQSQKETTLDSYLTEILSIHTNLDESGIPIESPVEPAIRDDNPSKKGPRRNHDNSESDSEDDDDKPSKKRKLHESDMPWFTSTSTTSNSNPSCQETCRLLREFNRDISKAKFFVRIAPNSPPGIPSSQWERILKGDSVDLNQIFASLHNVVPDEERTGRLGDTEISFGVSEAKKRISTASEWSSAWRKAAKAISFAFPHRREELFDYGDYLESEFAAKLPSSHHKLILYDVALRNEVAAGQHFLLTDYSRFSRLYSAIVMPDGVEGLSTQSTGKKHSNSPQTGGKPEICNKFNAGTCKNTDSDCKYRHVCKKCRKPGHTKLDCPKGT